MTASVGLVEKHRPIENKNPKELIHVVQMALVERKRSPSSAVDPVWLESTRESLSDLARSSLISRGSFAGFVRLFHALTEGEQQKPLPVTQGAFAAALGKLSTHPAVQLDLMVRNYELGDAAWHPMEEREQAAFDLCALNLEVYSPDHAHLFRGIEPLPGVEYMCEQVVGAEAQAIAS